MAVAQAQTTQGSPALPMWMSDPIRVYLAHTEGGQSIRSLARSAQCAPSTVLRQVRRTETLRDDPLADAGLTRFGQLWHDQARPYPTPISREDPQTMMTARVPDTPLNAAETLRILKALMEPETVLVVAEGVEDAVVVHNAGGDRPVRRAVLKREIAENLALRELIAGQVVGRIARYKVTPAGRTEASRIMAQSESRRAAAMGHGDDNPAISQDDDYATDSDGKRRSARRAVGAEPPLHVLARRRRADGTPYLDPEMVGAALRFRESYELSQIDARHGSDWDTLTSGAKIPASGRTRQSSASRQLEAKDRLDAAIRALGPDLAHSVIMSVCQDFGMETVEEKLDYPARSGKIVLRIALQTLVRHYAKIASADDDLIY